MDRNEQSQHALDWPAAAGAQDDVWRETERRVQRNRRRRLRLAAITCGVVVLALPVWRLTHSSPPGAPAASGESIVSTPTRQVLSDGSVVETRSGGPVTVAFTAAARRVILGEGEAYFQVAKGPVPFVVVANRVEIRAVGTAFSVQLMPHSVEVLVSEGIVAVDRPEPPAGTAASPGAGTERLAVLEAGRRVVVDLGAEHVSLREPDTLSAAELHARLAWRIPRLELSGTPLAEVLRALGEFSGTTFRLEDAALGQVRLSGVLRADNVDTLLQLLETNHGIVALERKDREIVLGRP